jgi:toxin ParE1/3/4
VPTKTTRVRRPRHLIVYRVTADGCVEVVRVLHDAMELERNFAER